MEVPRAAGPQQTPEHENAEIPEPSDGMGNSWRQNSNHHQMEVPREIAR